MGPLIDVNLSSVFNMSRVVIEKMRENKFGRIISMSSVNAHGMLGQTNYSAAKASIEGFTQALALEGARYGITANAIAPWVCKY
ncbi:MAG: SDR family NAD(P)-dependent oxidoreductase [Candidatus Midichloria mitochondrii]